MKDLVRHGDMLFRPAERLANLTPTDSRIIAKGEVTGHAHRITEGDAVILAQYEKQWGRGEPQLVGRFVEVSSPATVPHEEHKPVTLEPGFYQILQAREFDYGANLEQRVRD